MKDFLKKVAPVFIVLFFIAFIIFLPIWLHTRNEYAKQNPEIYTIYLSEIEDNVYAYQENVVSSAPLYNFSMATFCDTKGNIYTVKGEINVINTNKGVFYAVWEDVNIINSDKLTIYAPAKSVKYKGTTTISTRRF